MSNTPEISRRLKPTPIKTEEDRHPWSPTICEDFQVPLLRIWDDRSGSEPDHNNAMMARADQEPLDTSEARKESLKTHADHSKWTDTPFISFSASPKAIESLISRRPWRSNNLPQRLTVIDPNVRLRARLPVLKMAAEMNHYKVPDPYSKEYAYYEDEYLCLWQVDAVEIVGHWDWVELCKNPRWYYVTILPAFREFRRKQSLADGASLTSDTYRLMESIERLSPKFPILK